MVEFGRRLKAARKALRLSQEQVASRIAVHRTTYTKYETGVVEPPYSTLVSLCDVLQVTPNDLLGWKTQKP